MTRGELISQMRVFLGETDSGNSFWSTNVPFENNINWTMPLMAAEIEELLTFNEYTTTAGEEQYALPSDYLKVKHVEIEVTTDLIIELIPRTIAQFAVISHGAATQTGQPRFYKVEHGSVLNTDDPVIPGSIHLHPEPDDNGTNNYKLRIRYFQRPTNIATGTGEDGKIPELPEFLHPALAARAAAPLAIENKDTALAAFLINSAEVDIRKANRHYARLNRQSPQHIRDEMGYTRTEFPD